MKGLTVRQPWAECIAEGVKLIENRSQGFPKAYRGLLAIHAGQGWSARGATDRRVVDALVDALDPHREVHPSWPRYFARGYVIAVAEVVDIHPAMGCCEPWGEETYPPANPEARPPGRVTHIVLEEVRRLRVPVDVRGALGLWTVDPDIEREILRQAVAA